MPKLYTVSRDGALFAWSYYKTAAAAGAGPEGEGDGSEGEEEEAEGAQSREYAGGHWKLTEKYYFNQVRRYCRVLQKFGIPCYSTDRSCPWRPVGGGG